MSQDHPRIAIVGLGAFGRLHAECLARLEGAQLVALVDSEKSRAESLAAELGTPRALSSLDELIQAQIADAVVIATRSDTHTSLSLRAAEAGLDVLVEKPAAEIEEELKCLIQSVRQRDQVIMVNHICLFHSLVDPLLRRVAETGFRAAHFVRHRPATLVQRFPESHPLDLIMVHDLYIAARLVDGEEPVEWHLMEAKSPTGTVDMAWAALRWADGRTATFQSFLTLPESAPADGWDRLEVFGDGLHSMVQTNPAPWQWQDQQTQWPVGLEISSVQGRPTGMLAEAQRNFIAAIKGDDIPPGCRLEDALQIMRWTAQLKQKAHS